jgi:RNA methyltransferase, TrmH family
VEKAAYDDIVKSRDNSLIKLARALQDKKEREASGLALLEGVRLIGDALSQEVPISAVIYSEALFERPGGPQLLSRISQVASRVVMASNEVFSAVSTTETSQGVVALAQISWCDVKGLIERMPAGPLVVLDGVQDPGNVGTILRVSAASAACGVLIGPGTADPFSPKALRASAGSAFRVPVARVAEWGDAFLRLAAEGPLLVADTAGNAKTPWEWDLAGPCSIVLANEGAGPSPEVLSAATGIVTIPMPGGIESLNVAMSASILLYEAVRQRARMV